jgi:ferritin-like metal-binding protein YciE
MKINDLKGLFVHQLKDLYGAEKALAKAFPKIAKAVGNDDLRQKLEQERKETESQIERLEKLFEEFDVNTRGAKCPAVEEMIEDTKQLVEEIDEPEVLDAALICSTQRIKHYEIAGYGCLRALAEQLGKGDAAGDLPAILEEEKRADRELSELAAGKINREAVAQSAS